MSARPTALVYGVGLKGGPTLGPPSGLGLPGPGSEEARSPNTALTPRGNFVLLRLRTLGPDGTVLQRGLGLDGIHAHRPWCPRGRSRKRRLASTSSVHMPDTAGFASGTGKCKSLTGRGRRRPRPAGRRLAASSRVLVRQVVGQSGPGAAALELATLAAGAGAAHGRGGELEPTAGQSHPAKCLQVRVRPPRSG